VIADLKSATAQMSKLRALGIGIAVDDFGTGYSAFSCLHELAVDKLKIDRSFIDRLDGGGKGSATVATIIALAKQHGLEVVAEGVENAGQLEELQGMGCELLQGFLLARPLEADAAGLLASESSGQSATAAGFTVRRL
jgi:EAL domain-containing protein (putative c-di-GMP-specific phosphodiesterase class I)